MRIIKLGFLLFVFMYVTSCTEAFDMNLPNQTSKLIIDATITDGQPPYFVRLTLSKDAYNATHQYYDSMGNFSNDLFTPVLDGQIVISDNAGNVDTLIKDYTEGYHRFYNSSTESWDSTFYINNERGQQGYYRTTHLQGVAGNIYNLLVKWRGEEYFSTCKMPICPKIDSVTYHYTIGAEGKFDYYTPHIWFRDNPAIKNYYLFKTTGGGGVWSRSILSDEFISDKIAGLNVFQGESHDWWRNGYPKEGSYFKIEMYAVTQEVYEYYEALIGQFRSDGGIYTPTPASPPTNISGYVQGCFSASGFQMVEDVLPLKDTRNLN